MFTEGILSVLHDGVVVIGGTVQVTLWILLKLISVFCSDVVEVDIDVLISVGSVLLMHKAEGVHQFVCCCSGVNTAVAEGDFLLSALNVANIGVTAGKTSDADVVALGGTWNESDALACFGCDQIHGMLDGVNFVG